MYTLKLTSPARADLRRLDATVRKRVRQKFERLCQECGDMKHVALKGKHKGKFRVPVGDYRILYTFDTQTRLIEVFRIRHRSSVY